MKLASLKDGSRDGALHVVSADLKRAAPARDIAPTLIAALRNWRSVGPALDILARNLDRNPAAIAFDPSRAMAPLPNAPQFLDGSAYVTHVELVRKARGSEMPPSFWTDPLMYQGVSDRLIGPQDPVALAEEAWGIDFEAEVAVVVDDVPMGVTPGAARSHIQLVMLLNDVSLRNLIPGELAKGFGFLQSKPASSCSPVAATPDDLGDAWDGGRLHLPLRSFLNGRAFGWPDAGTDMTFDFPTLIAHAARTRHLSAGTIVGSGTVANRNHVEVGSSCLAERRMIETLEWGAPRTPFLKFGDRVRIEMLDKAGRSVFGAIDQKVVRYATEVA